MANHGENEGIRALEDFPCEAIIVDPKTLGLRQHADNESLRPKLTPTQTAELVRILEIVATRPHLCVGTVDIHSVQCFLAGFMGAIQFAFNLDPSVQAEIIMERGWQRPKASGPGPEHQMMQKGMSPHEIIAELVAIEIALLQRWASGAVDSRSA